MARAFIFFSYPKVITGDFIWIAGQTDAFSGATPLAHLSLGEVSQLPSMMEMLIGTIPGSVGETSKIAILLGAIFLVVTRVASLRIMLSVVVGGLAMGGLFNWIGGNPYFDYPAWQHLFLGGFLFGAVFMATDPVSAAHTPAGKIVYGFLIGVMAILIRVLNKGYHEGMMLAILFMNIVAPLIDYIVVQIHIKRRRKEVIRINNLKI